MGMCHAPSKAHGYRWGRNHAEHFEHPDSRNTITSSDDEAAALYLDPTSGI